MRSFAHRFRPTSLVALLVLLLTAVVTSLASPSRGFAAADPKAVAKCQAALAKAGAKFVAKKLGSLAKCTDGVFKCIQTVDESADAGAKRTACVEKARGKCASALGAITAARQAFAAAATKSCAGLDAAQLTGNDGLGFSGVDCTSFGGAATDLPSVASCLADQHDCLASQIFQLQVPRALELLNFTPPAAVAVAAADVDALACLDATGGTGADVDDVDLGKSVTKCQKAVAKIGGKLASQRLASLAKCVNGLFTCAQTKAGDDLTKCNEKARAGCAKAFAKNDDQGDAAEAATGKACGDAAIFTAMLSPAGGNLNALLPSALTLPPITPRALNGICVPLATVADYQRCLIVHVLGFADELVTFAAPRTATLLSGVGCTLEGCEGSGPPPPDVPGITQIVDAAGDGTHALDQPRAVAADAQGNVYVTAIQTDNVFKITPSGVVTQLIGPAGDGQGHPLESPGAVAIGAGGTVYVAGQSSDNVFKITANGTITEIIGPAGSGPGSSGLFLPLELAVGADQTVYVAASGSDNAFKITADGTVTEILNALGDGMGNGVSRAAGIAVDTQGNVFVSSTFESGVFMITPDGTVTFDEPFGDANEMASFGDTIYVSSGDGVHRRAPNGAYTRVLDPTKALPKSFSIAAGLATDSAGNLYAAAAGSDNVFQVKPDGTVTEIIDATGDGQGNVLNTPENVAVDGSNRIYVTGAGSDNAFRIILP